MMMLKKASRKTPSELNIFNSYLDNQLGKKHYWGVRGKDYGIVQSPVREEKKVSTPLDNLKTQHISYGQQVSKFSHLGKHKSFKEKYLREIDVEREDPSHIHRYRQLSKNYATINHNQKYLEKDKPVSLPHREAKRDRKQIKRGNLSLFSKNISLKKEPQGDTEERRDEEEIRQQMNNYQRHQRIKTDISNYNNRQIDEYRDRIVRIVRKDRTNNPTYCNSLNYPLPCFRYLDR